MVVSKDIIVIKVAKKDNTSKKLKMIKRMIAMIKLPLFKVLFKILLFHQPLSFYQDLVQFSTRIKLVIELRYIFISF